MINYSDSEGFTSYSPRRPAWRRQSSVSWRAPERVAWISPSRS